MRTPFTVFLVIFVFVAIGWQNEHDSCLRQHDVRAATRAKYILDSERGWRISRREHGAERAVNVLYSHAYRELAKAEPELDCSKVFPDTSIRPPITPQKILGRTRRQAARIK